MKSAYLFATALAVAIINWSIGSLASCSLSTTHSGLFKIVTASMAEFHCKSSNTANTEKAIETSFCRLTIQDKTAFKNKYELIAPLKVCEFKIASEQDLTISSLCCDIGGARDCTDSGEPKHPAILKSMTDLGCAVGASWYLQDDQARLKK